MTGYSQFGYGRRVCMGQGIAEADMFVGIAGMAWLFHLSKDFSSEIRSAQENADASTGKKLSRWFGYNKNNLNSSPKHTEPATIISTQIPAPTDNKPLVEPYNAEKNPILGRNAKTNNIPIEPIVPLDNDASTDPTLRFSHLLIAKPSPFQFDLQVRNQARAEQIQREYQAKLEKGVFPKERKYWENEGYLGWGKV